MRKILVVVVLIKRARNEGRERERVATDKDGVEGR